MREYLGQIETCTFSVHGALQYGLYEYKRKGRGGKVEDGTRHSIGSGRGGELSFLQR